MTDHPRGKPPDLQEQIKILSQSAFPGSCYEVRVTFFEDGHAEIRHGGHPASGPDEVLIDFGTLRAENKERAELHLRQQVEKARIAWLRGDAATWRLDGDAINEFLERPEKVAWLTGWREVKLHLDFMYGLRSGFESEWKASFRITAKRWESADQAPWEPRWTIKRSNVGSGGQAVIDKVVNEEGDIGALKVPRPEDQKIRERRFRMLKEVGALQFLDGRGVPRVLDSNVSLAADKQRTLYCVLEWVEGPTLEAFVHDRGPLSFDDARKVIVRLAETLDGLHREGYIHRDLHPRNVMLRHGALEDAVLIDFGMTSWEPEDGLGVTGKGQELGNRFLRLPEFAPGMHRDDPTSDVTQLCGLLLYLMTGQSPRRLADPDGRKPHERIEASRRTVLEKDQRWPRIARVLDHGFGLRASDRIHTVNELTQLLCAVDEPIPPMLEAELSTLETNVATNARLAEEQRVSELLRRANDEAICVMDAAIYGKPLVIETARTSLSVRHDTVEVQFFQQGGKLPMLEGGFECGHSDGKWSGVYRLPHLQPTRVFEITEEREVVAEMKKLAHRFLADAVRMMNLRYAAVRDGSVPLPLRDLAFAYPVGVIVRAERRDDKLVIAFGLRNNAGRVVEDVALHVLAPKHLSPETMVATASDEERWLRCLPEIVGRLDVDKVVQVFELTLTASHGADDSFILSVMTPLYQWTGSFKLDAAADLVTVPT